MKKAQMKERATMLMVFAMLKEGFKIIDVDPTKVDISNLDDAYDVKIVALYRRLNNMARTFANKKIADFLNKRLSHMEDTFKKECQPMYISIIMLVLYMKADVEMDFKMSVSLDDLEKLLLEYDNDFSITRCTITKAEDMFCALYPEKKGFVEFLKLSKRLPYNLKTYKGEEDVENN